MNYSPEHVDRFGAAIKDAIGRLLYMSDDPMLSFAFMEGGDGRARIEALFETLGALVKRSSGDLYNMEIARQKVMNVLPRRARG